MVKKNDYRDAVAAIPRRDVPASLSRDEERQTEYEECKLRMIDVAQVPPVCPYKGSLPEIV
jgi:hypothetical protein